MSVATACGNFSLDSLIGGLFLYVSFVLLFPNSCGSSSRLLLLLASTVHAVPTNATGSTVGNTLVPEQQNIQLACQHPCEAPNWVHNRESTCCMGLIHLGLAHGVDAPWVRD